MSTTVPLRENMQITYLWYIVESVWDIIIVLSVEFRFEQKHCQTIYKAQRYDLTSPSGKSIEPSRLELVQFRLLPSTVL